MEPAEVAHPVPEIWFYHLQRQTLDQVLPTLLTRALARDWNVVVEVASLERMNALDEWLWTFSEEDFLPHGTAAEGDPEFQPIWLTTGQENPNDAVVRILADGVDPMAAAKDLELERVIVLFDGNDDEQLTKARAHWKALKAGGHALSYWQQTQAGGWAKKA